MCLPPGAGLLSSNSHSCGNTSSVQSLGIKFGVIVGFAIDSTAVPRLPIRFLGLLKPGSASLPT